jgi:hypothetical protein
VKHGMVASVRHASDEYLPFYLNEFSCRFNSRKDPDIFQKVLALAWQTRKPKFPPGAPCVRPLQLRLFPKGA